MTFKKLKEILDAAEDIYSPDTEIKVESVIYHDSISKGIITGVIFLEDSLSLEIMEDPRSD